MKKQVRIIIKNDFVGVVGGWLNYEAVKINDLKVMLEQLKKMGLTCELEYTNKKGE